MEDKITNIASIVGAGSAVKMTIIEHLPIDSRVVFTCRFVFCASPSEPGHQFISELYERE
jgi:hypothetical protein